MDDLREITVANDLVILERGRDELLIVNPVVMNPLYVGQGRDYVKRLISSINDLQSLPQIRTEFPDDVELLELMLDRGIVLAPDSRAHGRPAPSMISSDGQSDASDVQSLELIVTQSCNSACIYCLNGSESYQKNQRLAMSEAVARKSVDVYLDQIEPGGTLQVIFFGGEPLLNWDLVKKTIKYTEDRLAHDHPDKKVQYTMTSNLTFLPADLIDWATRFDLTFLCDIDGPAGIHDRCRPLKGGRPSFATIFDNVRRLVDAGLDVAGRTTVTSINQDHLLETLRLFRDLGCSEAALALLSPINSDRRALPENLYPDPEKAIQAFEEVMARGIWELERLNPIGETRSMIRPFPNRQVGCGLALGKMPDIYVNGDAYPCIYFLGNSQFFLGNVFDSEFPDRGRLDCIYNRLRVDKIERCKNCVWRYICGGGCATYRPELFENHDLLDNQVLNDYCDRATCEYYKKMFELILWTWADESQHPFFDELSRVNTAAARKMKFC